MTPEQQRAMAIAAARRRAAEAAAASGQPAPASPPTPERGIGARLYDNFIGNPNDGVNSFGERVGTWLNRAGETMTLGAVGDEAAAAATSMLPGRSYESELERYRANEENMSGLGRVSADVAGALTGAMAAPIGTLARGASMGSRLAAGGLSGAGMGGVYGFAEGEGGAQERLNEAGQGAAIGGAAGVAAPIIGGLVQRGADAVVGNRAIRQAAAGAPTTDELRAAAQAGYRQIDDAGVQIRPEAFNRLVGGLDERLTSEGLDVLPGPGSLTPRSARVMEIARQMDDQMRQANGPVAAAGEAALPSPGQNVPGSVGLPFSSLDQLRRYAGNAASQVSPDARADARLGAIGIEQIDDFVRGLSPDDVTAGDVETLQRVIPQARDLWARMSRSGMIDEAIEKSENYLSGPASGLRNQFRRIVSNPRLSRGFSDAELSVMRRVAQGSIPERILYNMGSGLGQIGSTITGGALGLGGGPMGSIAGAATGAALSGGASRMAEGLARRNAEIARALVASGRLPAQLPVASDASRRIVEQLMMRNAATAAAQ